MWPTARPSGLSSACGCPPVCPATDYTLLNPPSSPASKVAIAAVELMVRLRVELKRTAACTGGGRGAREVRSFASPSALYQLHRAGMQCTVATLIPPVGDHAHLQFELGHACGIERACHAHIGGVLWAGCVGGAGDAVRSGAEWATAHVDGRQ